VIQSLCSWDLNGACELMKYLACEDYVSQS
jgi:hypothetical protein